MIGSLKLSKQLKVTFVLWQVQVLVKRESWHIDMLFWLMSWVLTLEIFCV